jgi:hypothetical protein
MLHLLPRYTLSAAGAVLAPPGAPYPFAEDPARLPLPNPLAGGAPRAPAAPGFADYEPSAAHPPPRDTPAFVTCQCWELEIGA